MSFVIGNTIALLGCILLVYSGCLYDKNKILTLQTTQIFLFVISNIVLGGYSGALMNLVSGIRNIFYHKGLLNNKVKCVIIALSSVITLYFNNLGLVGLAPLLGTTLFILFVDTNNLVFFKFLLILNSVLWTIYNVVIGSYVSVIFDLINVIVNTISIVKIARNNNQSVKKS